MKKVLLISFIFFTLLTTSACGESSKSIEIVMPKMHLFNKKMKPILGKVVFVRKDIYGKADLNYNCILKGKIKNITDKPYQNVYVVWSFWNEDDELFNIYNFDTNSGQPSIFVDVVEYLDSKAEADFQIPVKLNNGIGSKGAVKIIRAIKNNRYEIYIYSLKK